MRVIVGGKKAMAIHNKAEVFRLSKSDMNRWSQGGARVYFQKSH